MSPKPRVMLMLSRPIPTKNERWFICMYVLGKRMKNAAEVAVIVADELQRQLCHCIRMMHEIIFHRFALHDILPFYSE